MSEKRDSNSRPQPWQGCALPAELFSHGCLAFAVPLVCGSPKLAQPFLSAKEIDQFPRKILKVFAAQAFL